MDSVEKAHFKHLHLFVKCNINIIFRTRALTEWYEYIKTRALTEWYEYIRTRALTQWYEYIKTRALTEYTSISPIPALSQKIKNKYKKYKNFKKVPLKPFGQTSGNLCHAQQAFFR